MEGREKASEEGEVERLEKVNSCLLGQEVYILFNVLKKQISPSLK